MNLVIHTRGGLIKLSQCVSAFFLADPRSCRALGDVAAAIFREHCAGAAWELDQCNAFAYWSCYYLGDLPELARRQSVLLGCGQRQRSAKLAESQLTAFGGPFVWLANDDPAAAWEAVGRVSAYCPGRASSIRFITTPCSRLVARYSSTKAVLPRRWQRWNASGLVSGSRLVTAR